MALTTLFLLAFQLNFLSLLAFDARFSPEMVRAMMDNENVTVGYELRFDSENVSMIADQFLNIDFTLFDDRIGKVIPESQQFFLNQSETLQGNFTIFGKFIGKTQIKLRVTINEELVGKLYYDFSVQRSNKTLTVIFVSILGIFIVIANVMMGCELDMNIVLSVLKLPIAPLIGFLCQFVFMPMMSYFLAKYILVRPAGLYAFGLGLFTTGCSPGGGASNFWTILLKGNVDLSITMTFLSTLAALGMMPFWMWVLGSRFIGEDATSVDITIPYLNILMSLSALAIPLAIGVAIRHFKKEWAVRIRKMLRPFILIIITFILTFGVYANLYIFHYMTWRVLLCGLLLPWSGFAFGIVASLLTKQSHKNAVAIAIETGLQNSGIAIMLLKVSFEQPEAALSSVVPVAVSLFTPIPLMVAVCTVKVRQWMARRGQPVDEPTKSDADKAKKTVVEEHLPQKTTV